MGERLGHLLAIGVWACDETCTAKPPHGHPDLKGPELHGNRPPVEAEVKRDG